MFDERDIPENATVLDHGWGWRIYRIDKGEPRCFFDHSGDNLSLEEALESVDGDDDEVAVCRKSLLQWLRKTRPQPIRFMLKDSPCGETT